LYEFPTNQFIIIYLFIFLLIRVDSNIGSIYFILFFICNLPSYN